MPLPRTSKEKSARIDWGYAHRPGRLERVRGWLWALAALLVAAPLTAAAIVGALSQPPAPLAASASPGPLASPHAAWENRCEACHAPFTAIHKSAHRCETCHKPAAHHPSVKTEPGCTDCHRDHQGRTASLVRLSDAVCVRCHFERASDFARPDGHPAFRLAGPQRTLKFNHATHMAPGLGMVPGFNLGKIADPDRRTPYLPTTGAIDLTAPIQLECRSCHQLEADGRTYKPATFAAHCQACHPLAFDDSPQLRSVQAPHHVQPDALEAFLRQVYTTRFVADGLKGEKLDRGPGRLDPPPAVVEAARGKIDKAVAEARQTLLGGKTVCLECHNLKGTQIEPVAIPAKGMSSFARFDHTAHRAMDCQQCHPREHADRHRPNLPDAANCRQCHSPAGGVRHGCTDCHKYHGPGNGGPAHPFPTAAEWLRR